MSEDLPMVDDRAVAAPDEGRSRPGPDAPGDAELPRRLPCGADTQALLEQALDGPPAPVGGHQAGCVHCSAALAEYASVFAPLRAAARAEVAPPPDLLGSVLRRVRVLLGSSGWAVLDGDPGTTRLALDVVVRTVRHAADAVPGVRISLAAAHAAPGSPGPGVAVGSTGSTVAVEVTIAADHGIDLRRLGREVDDRVRAELVGTLGLRVASSTVHIDDVLTPRH